MRVVASITLDILSGNMEKEGSTDRAKQLTPFGAFVKTRTKPLNIYITFSEITNKTFENEEKCSYPKYVKANSKVACGVKLPEWLTMTESKQKCESMGASLPDIRSSSENNYYLQYLKVS